MRQRKPDEFGTFLDGKAELQPELLISPKLDFFMGRFTCTDSKDSYFVTGVLFDRNEFVTNRNLAEVSTYADAITKLVHNLGSGVQCK